jgi:exodeoxyribonuclease VII large subunit
MLAQRSRQCLRFTVERRRQRYDALAQRLKTARVAYANARRAQIERARERTQAFHERATLAVNALVQHRIARVERAARLLAAVSYRGVLARGFALVRDGEGRPLRTAAAVLTGMRLDIEFADGRVPATAGDTSAAPPPGQTKPRRGGGSGGQGSLFN